MNSPSSNDFDRVARQCFSRLITQYGYNLVKRENKPFAVAHVYEHPVLHRKIEVRNDTYSVDYGFSVFIYNTLTEEYNILYNVPQEQQDQAADFVTRASHELWSTEEIAALITGGHWKTFRKVYFQR